MKTLKTFELFNYPNDNDTLVKNIVDTAVNDNVKIHKNDFIKSYNFNIDDKKYTFTYPPTGKCIFTIFNKKQNTTELNIDIIYPYFEKIQKLYFKQNKNT